MVDSNTKIQASERETSEKDVFTHINLSSSFLSVQGGLEFLLSHFSEPLFPRKVSTATTRGKQYEIPDQDTALYYYKVALYEDCRIEAFGINQTNPDLIFIDLDTSDFASMRAFKLALTATLKNIKNKLGGFPTVYRSGRGCHVIQPIDCPVNLDTIQEFADLTLYPNNKFLQFTERYLSNGKSDSGNNPALRSCMIRVPGSLNSKCKAAGIDAEVKIIQRWDGYRPDYRLLIGRFYADLAGRKNQKKQQRRKGEDDAQSYVPGHDYGSVGWIEKLLQTPIDDYRYHSRNLILVPYLVLRRGITDVNKVTETVMKWADKCAKLCRLDPSRREFERETRSRVYEVVRDKVWHMSLKTLKEKNSWLYEKLRS